MTTWLWYAVAASILYGLHQVFTKLAAGRISDGLGGLAVEASAVVTIAIYLAVLWAGGAWNQKGTASGAVFAVLTGICVGAGTVVFFLLFQKGGPLSAVPAILAGGAALMAIAGLVFFRESVSLTRVLGIVLSIAGLILLKCPAGK